MYPSVEMKTYALLDNGSDSTFIKSSTLRKLDVDGPQMTLKLNTMYGQSEIVVKKIEGLIVQHVTKTTAPAALPKAYSQDFIPLKRNQIPTREIASKWPHLRQIKDQLLPLQEDMEVGLLIGYRPCTRRPILSEVSSIFDPLGFVAPVLLEGKAILQEVCRQNVGWDDPVPAELQARWLKWKLELEELENFAIPRCYKPLDFGQVVKAELHHFSDASLKGYGQCSYLRLTNQVGKVHCSSVVGKARVAPLKIVTVPRLELTSAVVSVRVADLLRKQLDVDITTEVFWTDRVVLGYIANDVKRFHIFVANRVQEIQEKSS
ncbi:uncharacterized protein [Acropora muricata]|uniref:uncharacterized protein n=1 Tax=Acropora muricata TaxID=159855 RepID=UPI0034E4185D